VTVALRLGLAATLGLLGLLGRDAQAASSPVGQLTVADCSGIEGWTQDPDLPLNTTDVHLYFGGPAGDPAATAVVVRSDLMLPVGCEGTACDHGFVSGLPMSLLDELEHPVHAYGIDLSGDPNLELEASPGMLSCPAPPIVGGELRHVSTPEVLAAWGFSIFFDRLLVDDALILALSQAAALDAGPSLAVADTADPTVWLLDGGFRRFVDPQFAGAWRFDLTTAVVVPVDELAAMPEGTAVRARPVLLQGTDASVYLLDDHQCTEGDPDPSCVEAPAGDESTGGGDDAGAGADTGGSEGGAAGGDSTGGAGSDGAGPTDGVPLTFGGDDDEASAGCGCRQRGGGDSIPWLLSLVGLVRWRRRAR
jgi:hypothetical protein